MNINHKSLIETIREYQKDFEDLGVLPFETAKLTQGRGRTFTSCYLNELQAHLLVMLSYNSPEVVAFVQARNEVAVLQEVINESENYLDKKRLYYQKQGYADAWIGKRLKIIEVQNEPEEIC